MRRPKPYYKTSHNSWYANIGPNRRPVKLAEGKDNEKAAWTKYDILMAGRQLVNGDSLVVDLVQKLIDCHQVDWAKNDLRLLLPSPGVLPGNAAGQNEGGRPPATPHDRVVKHPQMAKSPAKGQGGGGGQEQVPAVDTDRPIGQNHKRNLIRAVKAAFRWAEEEQYIERSPFRGVKVPAAIPRGDDAYLMPEQWTELIAAVKDAPARTCSPP